METQKPGPIADAMSPKAEMPLPGVLPIFPLPQTVLLPGEVLPLHVFEPRYRELVRDVLQGHRIFGVVAIEPGHEEDQPGHPPVRGVGCAGLIARHVELPGGRYLIWVVGLSRFTILEEIPCLTSYRQVRLDVGAVPESPQPLPPIGREALRLDLLAALPLLKEVGAERARPMVDLLARLDDDQLVAGMAQLLEVDPSGKQALLEAPSAQDRMRLIQNAVELKLNYRPGGAPAPDPRELN